MKNLRNKNVKMRQRGAFLLEAILALGVAISLIGLTANFIADEKQKQENILIAAEKQVVLTAARSFVGQRYRDIRNNLFAASNTNASNEAILSISVNDLITEGYLPVSFNGGGVIRSLYNQEFSVMVRGVLRSDTANPKATLTLAQMNDSGQLLATLQDGNTANDEMEIESLLVTYGGNPIPVAVGSDAVARLDTAFGGFVAQDGIARGPYANFTLDITPFDDLADYPLQGHFASVVSLSNFGVLGSDGEISEEVENDFLHRCRGLTIGSLDAETCANPNNNDVYNDIVLQPQDTNGDTAPDRFPAIKNLAEVECREDTGEDPTDLFQSPTSGAFLIDCVTTRIGGDVGVGGTMAVNGNIITNGALIAAGGLFQTDGVRVSLGNETLAIRNTDQNTLVADRMVIGAVDGSGVYAAGSKDLAESVLDSRIVRPNVPESDPDEDLNRVVKPICTGFALEDGTSALTPRIYATPSVYADSQGRSIVGVETYAIDDASDPTRWQVLMYIYVDDDANSDGQADRIAVDPAYGGVLVQTRCY